MELFDDYLKIAYWYRYTTWPSGNVRACSHRAVSTVLSDMRCRLFSVCLWNRLRVAVEVWKPPRWRDSPCIHAVGWQLETQKLMASFTHSSEKREVAAAAKNAV